MLLGILVVLLIGMVYMFYTKPNSSHAASGLANLERARSTTEALRALLTEYENGSEELSTATARFEAADRLIPIVDPGALEIEQYMRLNMPNKVQAALQGAGLIDVEIDEFAMFAPIGKADGVVAMKFNFRMRGSIQQLKRALDTLTTSGITSTLLSTRLVASEDAADACYSATITETACLNLNAELVVWFSAPKPADDAAPGGTTDEATANAGTVAVGVDVAPATTIG
jgi:hypothetical protein